MPEGPLEFNSPEENIFLDNGPLFEEVDSVSQVNAPLGVSIQVPDTLGFTLEELPPEAPTWKRAYIDVEEDRTLSDIALEAYGQSDTRYTDLIRRNNVIKFREGKYLYLNDINSGAKYVARIGEEYPVSVTRAGYDITRVAAKQRIFCPPPTAENLDYRPDEPIEAAEEREPVSFEDNITRINSSLRAFRTQRGQEQEYMPRKRGLGVVLFSRGSGGKITRVREVQDIATRVLTHASLFEGVRAVEFSLPVAETSPDRFDELQEGNDALWRVGDTVMISYDEKVVFMGVLLRPKIRTGEKSIEWRAESHSCTFVKSHLNPQSFLSGWVNMTPLEIIAELSEAMGLPLDISPYAAQELSRNIMDQDRLTEINSDITTTTPFSFIARLAQSIGFRVTSSKFGHFLIEEVRTDAPNEGTYEAGKDEVEFGAEYDYGDLAQTYTVLSQRREANEYGSAKMAAFPLTIFRNLTTDFTVFNSLSEAASFEGAKALAEAVKMTMVVPAWIDKKGNAWRVGSKISAYSEICQIYQVGFAARKVPLEVIVSSVELFWSKTEQRATIGLTLKGCFLPLAEKQPDSSGAGVQIVSETGRPEGYDENGYRREGVPTQSTMPFLTAAVGYGFGYESLNPSYAPTEDFTYENFDPADEEGEL